MKAHVERLVIWGQVPRNATNRASRMQDLCCTETFPVPLQNTRQPLNRFRRINRPKHMALPLTFSRRRHWKWDIQGSTGQKVSKCASCLSSAFYGEKLYEGIHVHVGGFDSDICDESSRIAHHKTNLDICHVLARMSVQASWANLLVKSRFSLSAVVRLARCPCYGVSTRRWAA